MKTLYITRGGSNVLVNSDDNSANRVEPSKNAVGYVYKITEPTHVVYGCGEYHKQVDAEKGDIIVCFYHATFINEIIVVKNKEWFDNLEEFEKKEQEEKERWAEANSK